MKRSPELAVVVPLYNEIDNLDRLCEELDAAMQQFEFEALFVDDGSTDGSADRWAALERTYRWLRVARHPRNVGQSAAFCTGVLAARAALVATIDGDLQNDPADIPRLIETWKKQPGGGHVLVAGNRVERCDTWIRRTSSGIANRARRALLGDNCLDTGCSLKLFRRDDYLMLPQFDHMHRFLPALFAREGLRTINVPVRHRARSAGQSKYGIRNRLWVGVIDLLGAHWLLKRRFVLTAFERQEAVRIMDEGPGDGHE